MPPEGYDTVTLPIELVERIDERAEEELRRPSRVVLIRKVLDETIKLPDGDGGDVYGDPIGTGEFNEVLERLSRIESAASTAEERTGSIENTLEGLSR